MKVLVIAAHPDDEVLGCGGTMARLAAEGAAISVLILATGLSSRETFDPARDAGEMERHHARARQAGQLLGARRVDVAGYPDQRMDTVPLLDITQRIEAHIREVQPAVVFTQHGGDLNMDHVITFRATLAATRPMANTPVKTVYAYEVNSSTEWAFQQFEPRFTPQVFFEVGEYLDRKVAAMRIYGSEIRPFPHPRSEEAIRAAAVRWGSVTGLRAAEAFACVRDIR